MRKVLSFILSTIAFLQTFASRSIKWVFTQLMRLVERPAVRTVFWLTERFQCETNVIENAFVLFVLVGRLVAWWWMFNAPLWNIWSWLELFAAFRVAQTTLMAQRFDERQKAALEIVSPKVGKSITVHCAPLLERYYFDKEAIFMAIFIHGGLWSLLIISIPMMLLYPWREAWRRHKPLQLSVTQAELLIEALEQAEMSADPGVQAALQTLVERKHRELRAGPL